MSAGSILGILDRAADRRTVRLGGRVPAKHLCLRLCSLRRAIDSTLGDIVDILQLSLEKLRDSLWRSLRRHPVQGLAPRSILGLAPRSEVWLKLRQPLKTDLLFEKPFVPCQLRRRRNRTWDSRR